MNTAKFLQCILAHNEANPDTIVLAIETESQDFTLRFRDGKRHEPLAFTKKVLAYMDINPGLVLLNSFQDSFDVTFLACKKKKVAAQRREEW